MKIYTKRGDRGETDLLGAVRIGKDSVRIRAYGALDELNAALGWGLAAPVSKTSWSRLIKIQEELFVLGSELATPPGKKGLIENLSATSIKRLEDEIDDMESSLPPLRNFILPGGTEAGARLHWIRTCVRAVEREIISLHAKEPVRNEVIEYINRLSDYLFVAARWENHLAETEEQPWIPRA